MVNVKRTLLPAAVIVGLILVIFYLSNVSETTLEQVTTFPKDSQEVQSQQQSNEPIDASAQNANAGASETLGSAAIKVPALDDDGKAVVTWLTVDVMPGKGRTLADINQLLFWVDTQYSIQVAKAVAANYTKMDLSKLDITYAIETDADIIAGPSAGAALTVATVSALLNSTPNPNVMITGSILPDGSIGEVGGVVEKAMAAKSVGATLFLVPEGQSKQTQYKQERKCESMVSITYCTTKYLPIKTDIQTTAGIDIKEVSTVNEALKYFLG
jgi:uncharacterized protein